VAKDKEVILGADGQAARGFILLQLKWLIPEFGEKVAFPICDVQFPGAGTNWLQAVWAQTRLKAAFGKGEDRWLVAAISITKAHCGPSGERGQAVYSNLRLRKSAVAGSTVQPPLPGGQNGPQGWIHTAPKIRPLSLRGQDVHDGIERCGQVLVGALALAGPFPD